MSAPQPRWPRRVAGTALAALLVVNVPLFLCMPLATDANLYDLCARNVLRGGVHYRDVLDNNFPGIVWLHAGIRSVVGWRSEAIRLADLGILTGIVLLLLRWLKVEGRPLTVRLWTAFALFGYYFSTSEWCHCQRDTWMLLPALAALHQRRLQVDRLLNGQRCAAWAVREGLLWGAAFWIKPFVAVPAVLCWLASAVLVTRQAPRQFRWIFADLAGLLFGGMLIGGLGCLWLWRSGSWPYFWDVFLNWNAEYLASGRSRFSNVALWRDFMLRSFPWTLAHVVAVPVALLALQRALSRHALPAMGAQALLATFYLGWLVQAVLLQNLLDYVYVPPVLLAVAVVAGWSPPPRLARASLAGLLVFSVAALLAHPSRRPERLALWGRCTHEGSTPQLRSRLALLPTTDWEELARVRAYLHEWHCSDEELLCFTAYTLPLYLELDVKPATCFAYFDVYYDNYPKHRRAMRDELLRREPRFIVADLQTLLPTWPEERHPLSQHWPADLPVGFRDQYPWTRPVVFRAGRYVVLMSDGPMLRDDDPPAHPGWPERPD